MLTEGGDPVKRDDRQQAIMDLLVAEGEVDLDRWEGGPLVAIIEFGS